jgi:DNA-binding response OmpR family regulator
MKILVVDDDPTIRQILVDRLTNAGHEVFEANDGKLGGRLCLELRPDWTVTDMSMLWMDGPEMIAIVRKEWPEAKFIGMSAARGWNLPSDVVLLDKPFDIKRVMEYLK